METASLSKNPILHLATLKETQAVGKCSSRFRRDEVLRNEAYVSVRRSDEE